MSKQYASTTFSAKAERRLPALAVSRGIGIGRVVFLHDDGKQFSRIDLEPARVEAELTRLNLAVAESIRQLKNMAAHEGIDPRREVSSIFGVHLLIIEESSLIEKVRNIIQSEKVNFEWALKVISAQYAERQTAVADVRFREKSLDIDDVAERLITALNGSPSTARSDYTGAVVVARELRPSEIMELKKSGPAAIVTERGGWTSHSAILAREYNLPMVSGIGNLVELLSEGDAIIVDGLHDQIVIGPSSQTTEDFRALITADSQSAVSTASVNGEATTLDGTGISIAANVDTPEAYRLAKTLGAKGIGLLRTESFIDQYGAIPSEQQQILAYQRIADVTGGDGMKIRTFDIGAGHFNGNDRPRETNPALGLRSIRLSLSKTDDFRTQIRAILRASVDRTIDLILPMISGVDEIVRSKVIIEEERERLAIDGIRFGNPRLGAMIEVPSGVLTARQIAKKVDFICLGTNDLVQYLLAVDRDNDAVADWYQTLHPAVIRAISEVLTAGSHAKIPVTVCGEMAGSPFYIPVLLGLGAQALSINTGSISQVRRLISGVALRETVELVKRVKTCESAEETEHLLRKYYSENWAHLFPSGLLSTKHR